MVLQSFRDPAGRQCDLPRHKVFAAPLRFVVEQNPVHCEHAVGFSVLLDHPEAVLLGNCVRAVRMERRRFSLRHFLDLAEKLGRRRLINFRLLRKSADPDRFKNTKNAERINVARVFRSIKRDLHMRLSRQIVDFIRLYFTDDADQGRGIGQVAVMQGNGTGFDQMIDPCCVGNRAPSGDAVHLVSFFQKELGEIGTILTGDSGYERFVRHRKPPVDAVPRTALSCCGFLRQNPVLPCLTVTIITQFSRKMNEGY